MLAKVKKWGNSASIRIPASVMSAANLHLNDPVYIHEEDGRIIIESATSRSYQLKQLLDGITEDNLHGAVDFGKSVGKEEF